MFKKLRTTILLFLCCFNFVKADSPTVILTPNNVNELPLPQVVKGLKARQQKLAKFTEQVEKEINEYIKSEEDIVPIIKSFVLRLLDEMKKETTTNEFKRYIILKTFDGYLTLESLDLIENFVSKKVTSKFLCAWVDIMIQWAEDFAEWCILNKQQKITICIEEIDSSGKKQKDPFIQVDLFNNLDKKNQEQINKNLEELKKLIGRTKQEWNKLKNELGINSKPTTAKGASTNNVNALLEAMDANALIINPISTKIGHLTSPKVENSSWISQLVNSTIISPWSKQRLKNGMFSTASEIIQEQFSDLEINELKQFFNSPFYKRIKGGNSRTGKPAMDDIVNNFCIAALDFLERFGNMKLGL